MSAIVCQRLRRGYVRFGFWGISAQSQGIGALVTGNGCQPGYSISLTVGSQAW